MTNMAAIFIVFWHLKLATNEQKIPIMEKQK